MDDQSLRAIEITCWAIAACFGIPGIGLRMLDAWQSDEARNSTRDWYRGKLHTLQQTRLRRLPETVIEWLLQTRRAIGQGVITSFHKTPKSFKYALPIILSLASLVSAWILLGWRAGVGVAILSGCLPVVTLIQAKTAHKVPGAVGGMALLLATSAWLVGIVCGLKILLALSTVLAALVMLGVLPLFALGLGLVVGTAGVATNRDFNSGGNAGLLVGMTMALSFFVTLCALLIGHAIQPGAHVPQTLQMLFSNVICDGLTMLATFLILGAAVGPKRRFSIPVAILLDFVLAAVLACMSLWCGMVGKEDALSASQVFRVLIFQAPAGAGIELGPYFWAMHTTFLPTMFYLSIILLCWLGKLVVLPLATVFHRLSTTEKPHNASAFTLLFVAAIFGALAKGLGFCQD